MGSPVAVPRTGDARPADRSEAASMSNDAFPYGRSDGAAALAVLQSPMRWGSGGAVSPEAAFALPVGTVTFLLTDVEGSTRMWGDEDPEAMRAAIVRHGVILATAVTTHAGVRPQEQGEGDSIVAAFAKPSDALRAARDAQLALQSEPWPTSEPLRVRMAIHTGEAQLRDDANYAGQAIIRTARLRTLGHGGQVLVSQATRDLAVDQLGDEVELRTLGEQRLRDLGRPEVVWQLVDPGLDDSFPPLITPAESTPHNLPVSLSPFIGRLDEIATLARLVRTERMVTATGAGGAGKTRLAQQTGGDLLDRFSAGVWWVELAPLNTSGDVAATVAAAVGIRQAQGDPIDAVAGRLRAGDALLVLDNCEHVIDAARDLAVALLAACPRLHVLATSRAALDVPGEVSWRVPPMSLPTARAAVDVAALSQYDAVRLFLDRARRARPTFLLDDTNAAAIAELCVRLDGMPLAIELAAARSRLLPPAQILAGVADAFRLLTGGSAAVMPRQQTLEASIAWSYDLLALDEQRLLRRLSVFAGGCTLEAAEGVCADEHLDAYAVFDLLDRLVGHSLVQADDTPEGARFRLLETIRQFAHRLLQADGDDEARTVDAHTRTYMQWVIDRHDAFRSGDAGDLLPALRTDEANITTAIDQAIGRDPMGAVDVLDALRPMLTVEISWGVRLIERCETLLRTVGEPPPARLVVLHSFANLFKAGRAAHAIALLGRAAELADAEGDTSLASHCRCYQAAYSLVSDEPQLAAIDAHLAALANAPSRFLEARSLASVALLASGAGHVALGRRCLAALAALDERRHPAVATTSSVVRASNAESEGRPLEVLSLITSADVLASGDAYVAAALARAMSAAGDAQVPLPSALADRLASLDPSLAMTAFTHAVADFVEARRTDVDVDTFAGHVERVHRASIAAGLGRMPTFDYQARLVGCRPVPLPPGHAQHAHDGVGLLGLIIATDDLQEGRLTEAADRCADSIRACVVHGAWASALHGIELLARVLSVGGDRVNAARLLGGVEAFRNERHLFRFPALERTMDATIAETRAALGDDAFDAAFAEGASLDIDQLCEFALRQRADHAKATSGWHALTPTEAKVADLVVAGNTNAQVAKQLIMSPETVKTHLSRVYAKVGVANRQQLTSAALRRA
jgi:predicted ATPase/class 3 adenylate cyclase/DNA-binding CsgD family transcriptional regulator